jgi:hypothetical protein
MGIPLSQEVTFARENSSGHGTSSTLEFLNQRWPVAGNPVAELINSHRFPTECHPPWLYSHQKSGRTVVPQID